VLQRNFDDGTGTQVAHGRSSGAIFGLEAEATPMNRLRFRFVGLGGNLRALNAPDGETGRVFQALFDVGVAPFSWLWIQLGTERRSFKPVGGLIGQWTSLRVGTEARYGMGAGTLEGVVRITYLPFVSTNTATAGSRPSFGLASEVGVDYRRRMFNAGVHYGLERIDFPEANGFRQREQVSTLRIRIGLEFGK